MPGRTAGEQPLDTVFSAPFVPRGEALEEAAWLGAARQGEAWALERFYSSYQDQVYGLCFRLLGRPEDARDATQTAFVRAFRELPRFRGESAVKTWLYRIAVNEALTMLRRRRDTVEVAEDTAGTTHSEPQIVECLAVRAALECMKPAHRSALILRYWEGLSYEEIAEVLRISLSAAKMRLKRAREEFRKCYEEGP